MLWLCAVLCRFRCCLCDQWQCKSYKLSSLKLWLCAVLCCFKCRLCDQWQCKSFKLSSLMLWLCAVLCSFKCHLCDQWQCKSFKLSSPMPWLRCLASWLLWWSVWLLTVQVTCHHQHHDYCAGFFSFHYDGCDHSQCSWSVITDALPWPHKQHRRDLHWLFTHLDFTVTVQKSWNEENQRHYSYWDSTCFLKACHKRVRTDWWSDA